MKRLTYRLNEKEEKDMSSKYLHYKYCRVPDYDFDRGNYGRITSDMLYNKLGELEDIEEELGIDLITLFKALKDGIYQKELYFPNVKNHLDAKYLRLNTWYNQLEWTDIWNGCNVYEFELKDYGKTWWLKEDKEKLNNLFNYGKDSIGDYWE